MQMRWAVGCFLIILMLSNSAMAGWSGPKICFVGQWGQGIGQLRYDNGDGETVPEIRVVTPDGRIIIFDTRNHKQVVVDCDGKLIKEVNWTVIKREGGRTTYDIQEYGFFGKIVSFNDEGDIYFEAKQKYYLVSPTGTILRTFDSYPKEIKKRTFRDEVSSQSITRFNPCEEKIAELHLPSEGMAAEFGAPLILPNGDVYIWKKTDANYTVLKWTWSTDPSALDSHCKKIKSK